MTNPMTNLGEFRELVRRGVEWTSHHGLRASIDRASAPFVDRRWPSLRAYERWTRTAQRQGGGGESLLVSVLVPVRDPLPQHLDALYASLCEQDHGRWEAIFVDDGSLEPVVRRRLSALAARDGRVRTVFRATCGGVSRATNDAAAAARGRVLLFVDHDDVLGRGVLGAIAAVFGAHPRLDLVYTDEDQLTAWGARTAPVFKPGPSPWLALGFHYMTHLVALRRELFDVLDGLRPDFDGAQDHDLVLRAFERARGIGHLPLIGYHWRRATSDVSAAATSRPWACEAGRRAVEEACRRRRLPVHAVTAGQLEGVYRLELEPLPTPPRLQVMLHGPEHGARVWLERLRNRPDLLTVAGATIGRWPVLPEAASSGAGWLVIDSSLVPDERPLEELLRWTQLPGVGGVAASGGTTRRRRHLGYGLREDGLAEPILPGLSPRAVGPGLLATSPREVAASAHGLLWVQAPPAWLAAELAGRSIDSAGVLCLSLTPTLTGAVTLFHPGVMPLQGGGQRWLPLPLDLGIEPAWTRLRSQLPAELFVDGADRFCPRHELLVELGMPHPLPRVRGADVDLTRGNGAARGHAEARAHADAGLHAEAGYSSSGGDHTTV